LQLQRAVPTSSPWLFGSKIGDFAPAALCCKTWVQPAPGFVHPEKMMIV